MKEALDNARQELKRVDHLFYVSLKYTRTADMMRHMVERLISTFSFGIESLLKHAKDQKKVDEIPDNMGMRTKLAIKNFPDEEFAKYIDLYSKLRKIIRAKFTKREEFRRHVTMTCTLDNKEIVEVLKINRGTAISVRKKYVEEGLESALKEKKRSGAPLKVDSRVEASITMIACSDPPSGCSRWTLQLIGDKLVELKIIDNISRMTVERALKKTS